MRFGQIDMTMNEVRYNARDNSLLASMIEEKFFWIRLTRK